MSVFPTPVGVFLYGTAQHLAVESLPHARGGVSLWVCCCLPRGKSSPRPWGCFHHQLAHGASRVVFPTPVGVFPRWTGLSCARLSLPHARGGVSRSDAQWAGAWSSSPRPWGCFHLGGQLSTVTLVFPTPVGVFLGQTHSGRAHGRLPHARGGVSTWAASSRL